MSAAIYNTHGWYMDSMIKPDIYGEMSSRNHQVDFLKRNCRQTWQNSVASTVDRVARGIYQIKVVMETSETMHQQRAATSAEAA